MCLIVSLLSSSGLGKYYYYLKVIKNSTNSKLKILAYKFDRVGLIRENEYLISPYSASMRYKCGNLGGERLRAGAGLIGGREG